MKLREIMREQRREISHIQMNANALALRLSGRKVLCVPVRSIYTPYETIFSCHSDTTIS